MRANGFLERVSMDMHFSRSEAIWKQLAASACLLLCCMGAGTSGGWASTGKTITLRDAIETALKANIDLMQATNLVEAKELSVKRSRTDFLPDLRLSMGTSRSYSKQYNDVSRSFEGAQSYGMNLSVSSGVTLFSGFERLASLRQSQLELEAERKSLTRSREQIIFETVQQFVIVVLDGDLIKVNEENLEAQRRQLAQIEAFTTSGRRPVVDLYQQQASVAEAESRLLVARRDYGVDKYGLLQILAIDPGAERDIVVPDIDNISTGVSGLVRDEAVEEGSGRRADLAAQRLQVEAARKQITASRSGYWPSVSLSASAGTSYRNTGGYDFNDQFYNNNPSGSISLSLSVPIFDRLATHYSVSQAKVSLGQAQLGAERLELQVKVDIKQALEDYATATKAVEVAEAQLKYSAQALRNMEERYKVNASTLVELMQARASNLQSSYDLINARYGRLVKGLAVLYYSGTIGNAMPLFE
jgi:outer membrane protein